MRLPRSGLVERLARPGAATVILLEAPSGYGKSWLLRQARGPDTLNWRGEPGELGGKSFEAADKVALDDAHLLDDEEIERLVDHIEFDDGHVPLLIAGRLLDDRLHQVAELVDGVIIDATGLSVSAEEIVEFVPNRSMHVAEQVVDVTDGEVRAISATLDHVKRQPRESPVTFAGRVARAANTAAYEHLRTPDDAIVGVLARCPGLGRQVLAALAGPGVLARLLDAGIPLRRHPAEGLELAGALTFKTFPVDRSTASRFAAELVHDRPIDAVSLLLDAGEHEQAARVMTSLTESVTESIEPRTLLGLLSRFGGAVERNPALLLLRASASAGVGRASQAIHDVDLAEQLADDVPPALRRRVMVESARARLAEGHRDEAVRQAEAALTGIEAGEERTFARAHEVLAECALTSQTIDSLQRAAESFRVAAAAWDGCDEFGRARACRRGLALGVLVALGRFDQALAYLRPLHDALDQSDGERAVTLISEGFVLVNAGRLDGAGERFDRAKEIGLLHDNPRLIAAAAWGWATVASRRNDLELTLGHIAEAENTGLNDAGDSLGVPFLCDVAEMLGALGELDLAESYLRRAKESATLFPDVVATTVFILDARCGRLGDVGAQLERTPPLQRWRVQLVAAHACARAGDLERARQLLADSERELMAMGRASAASLGESREYEALNRLLHRSTAVAAAPAEPAVPARPVQARAAVSPGRRLRVFGSPITVWTGDEEVQVPSGNPQRLIGVVAAAGGSASFDQIGEAMWPNEEVGTSRTRLRNVLMRLRRAVGDVLVRSEVGVRLATDVSCDLHEFERAALDAISSTRADPDTAGRLATYAVQMASGTALADFEYEEWAVRARRTTEQRLIGLLDLLSIQAEDAGDLPMAQAMAERALQLDRYTDSRYVRLAELLVLQDRNAAAIAVLDDAAAVARSMGESQPLEGVDARRKDIMRRTASGG